MITVFSFASMRPNQMDGNILCATAFRGNFMHHFQYDGGHQFAIKLKSV